MLSDKAFREIAKQRSFPENFIRMSFGYYEASRRGEFGKVDSTLEQLIGRRPETMEHILRGVLDPEEVGEGR